MARLVDAEGNPLSGARAGNVTRIVVNAPTPVETEVWLRLEATSTANRHLAGWYHRTIRGEPAFEVIERALRSGEFLDWERDAGGDQAP